MKKVIAIIFVFFLSFGLFSFVDNSIAWAEEITGGTNYENAPLLTEETTSVVVTVKQFWNDMGQEMYAPLGRIFKFKPSESGVYTITTAGIEDDTNTFCFTVDEAGEPYNKNIYYYDNIIKFNHKLEGLVAGETYYISIDARSRYSTNYTISFDRPLMSSSAESNDATLSGITVDNIAVTNFDSANTTYDLGLTTKSSIEINAITNDPNAAVSGDISAQDLSIGQNTFILTVTAEDGTTTKDYIINIIREQITIDPIEDIKVDRLEESLPRVYVRDKSGQIVDGKVVKYTCDELSDYATIFSSDRCIYFNEDIPVGTYEVTVSLEDNSAEPITFNIIIRSSIVLSPDHTELVKDGTEKNFIVPLPEVTVLDAEGNPALDADGNLLKEKCRPVGADFMDYIVGEPTENDFYISKSIPLGAYALRYGIPTEKLVSKDFKIIIRNPSITYTAGEGGSITGDIIQSVAPGENGTEVTAVPETGYKFVKWSDGETKASRTDTNITSDINLTAEFAENGKVSEVTIDKPWDGSTLQASVEAKLSGNPVTDITTLNITAGELTDADVMWITNNLENLTILNIIGATIFTDETLPEYAFSKYNYGSVYTKLAKLEKVTIDIDDSKIIKFSNFAFVNCGKLTNVNLPNVTEFGSDAFANCGALTSVNLPKVTQFGDSAFNGCTKAISMTLGAKPPTINDFGSYIPEGDPIIIVPESVKGTYDEADSSNDDGYWYQWKIETIDETPPTVTEVTMESNNADKTLAKVGDTITLNITASEAIQEPTVSIAQNAAVVSDAGDEDASTWEATYTMQSKDTEEAIRFTLDFKDLAGNSAEQVTAVTSRSTVPFDKTAPTVTNYSPVNGVTDVALDSNVEIIFGENIEKGTGNIKIFRANDGSVTEIIYAASDKVSVMGAKATINPENDLANGTEYYVQIENGSFIDEAGNAYVGISDKTTWSFTTGAQPDTQVPTIESFSPAKGATEVAIDSNLEIIFGENIEKGTGNINIFRANDGSVTEIIYAAGDKVSVMGSKAVIDPESDLEYETEYYVQIENGSFIDEAGNAYLGISNKTTWSFKTISQNNSTGGSSNKGNSDSGNKENIKVKVNGQTQTGLGQAQTQIKNGQIVTIVKVNGQKLKQKLEQEGQGPTVTIPVQNQRGIVVGKLNGQMVKTMEENAAVLEISTDKAGYILPAKQIKIDQVSKALGQQVSLKDIIVEVEVGETPKEMVKVVENTASKDNFTLVVPPVDFTVKCTHRDQTIEVKGFSNYVARIIAIPDGVDHNKITTGLITYPDGTTCHVPTKIIQIEGIYYAKINSLTNSTYTVIWNTKNYQDVKEHWAQAVCNEMGARKVVEGTTEEMFSPDQQVTRLTFTQAIVRALGIGEKGTQCKFTDVDQNKPYFGAVATGCEYSLVGGYEDDTFRAFNNVTREEAAALLVRAMKIAGLKTDYTEIELQQELNRFVDEEEIGAWAREVVAICVKNDMIVGNERGEFMPQEKMTRAQLAAIMMRMLQKAELI